MERRAKAIVPMILEETVVACSEDNKSPARATFHSPGRQPVMKRSVQALQRCTVHKHRNLLAHAPKKPHAAIGADYTDMIYDLRRDRRRGDGQAPEVPAHMAAALPGRRRQPGGGG
jgi:hypothetical protein